ncbi:hypothetical protein B0O99DRAFT_640091 [Bisporella sp. PMI_857]|nr:hypothetical protein B0O99DRAFT_640091 [Bisporella sp. PMI_857]
MKGFYLGVFSLAFFPHSISAAPTSPLDRPSPCHSEFLLEVEINAYGAAVASDPTLSISSISWEGFPMIRCSFSGVEGTSVLSNSMTNGSAVTFDVGPRSRSLE